MENDIYTMLVSALAPRLGSASPHTSGTGARFTSARKGKATVYHSDIAAGNHAEVAFEVESMANALGMTAGRFRSLLAQLRAATGRPVEPNPRFNWPRVGVASEADVTLIAHALRQ
jgi:hypothetical protein